MKTRLALLALVSILAGCGGGPPPADWKLNAVSLLDHAQQRWLEGDSPAADLAQGQARLEIARSGRTDLLARAELAACAARVASLDFAPCAAFDKLVQEATPADRAYARFLAGDWTGLETKDLPPHYAGVLAAKDAATASKAAGDIKDPLPRLLAIALIFKAGRAEPASLATALDAASERGWRRPLLAWLEVNRQRALAAGDTESAAHFLRRKEFVLQSTITP